MALSTLAIMTLALSGAAASTSRFNFKKFKGAPKPEVVEAPNQLETARITQAAQRVEFGVEGDASAFKFSFSDPVRPHQLHRSCCRVALNDIISVDICYYTRYRCELTLKVTLSTLLVY